MTRFDKLKELYLSLKDKKEAGDDLHRHQVAHLLTMLQQRNDTIDLLSEQNAILESKLRDARSKPSELKRLRDERLRLKLLFRDLELSIEGSKSQIWKGLEENEDQAWQMGGDGKRILEIAGNSLSDTVV